MRPNAMSVLESRYLRRDDSGRIVESPEELFARVARTIAQARRAWGASSGAVLRAAENYEEVMVSGRFLPNSPTLMNAGRRSGMLSACVVLPLEDSLDGIMATARDIALVQRAGAGTGLDVSRLRPRGSRISTGGVTGGPVSFLRMLSAITTAIQPGAYGRGANMAVMRIDHPDVLEFIDLKSDAREVTNYNLSVAVTDEFVERLDADPGAAHTVVDPHTGVPGLATCSVGELWQRIASRAWQHGDPGLVFIDEVNRHNTTPAGGAIRATNPCGEQPLPDNEACNLGSLNLASFCLPGQAHVDFDALARTVRVAVAFLDDVIDVNHYPTEAIRATCLRNRRIGLGVMGFADLLFRLRIPYDSPAALGLAGRLASFVRREAWDASAELARERGPFPGWRDSTWCYRDGRPMRNAAVTTVAPTGTLSILAGCTGGIEPAFSLAFERRVLGSQRLEELNPVFFAALGERGLDAARIERVRVHAHAHGSVQGCNDVPSDLRAVFRTAMDMRVESHVRMQAAWQAHTDAGVSKTVNLPSAATVDEVAGAFRLAHGLRCKGITVYRDGSRMNQPMSLTGTPRTCSTC